MQNCVYFILNIVITYEFVGLCISRITGSGAAPQSGHSKFVRREYEAVGMKHRGSYIFLSWWGFAPSHTPKARALPQAPCICSDIKCVLVSQTSTQN